ncbi:MAG: hypothetical protein ACK5FE_07380 [Cyanobacteriota bacterium]
MTVNGTDYTVDSFLGSYQDDPGEFTPSQMPWWGDNDLASQFANAVAASLNTPNPPNLLLKQLGPYFATETFQVNGNEVTGGSVYDQPPVGAGQLLNCTSTSVICTSGLAPVSQDAYYATATNALTTPSAAVPGPLPAFGVLGALGWSRRLRNRIRQTGLEA